MRRLIAVSLLNLLAPGIAAMAEDDPSAAATAAAISETERRLPWFWSPTAEGLADIPYTYEELLTRRLVSKRGHDTPPNPRADGLSNWRTLRLERIPLDWGAFMRCLSQDGVSPCSKEWTQELERQTRNLDALTPEDRARIDLTRQAHRQRRRDFWDRFPAAFRFELAGSDQLRFLPLPRYKPPSDSGTSMLAVITGRLSFDLSTHEVTHLEYDLLHDVDEPFARLSKGSRFEIELAKLPAGHYVPRRIMSRTLHRKSGVIEERTVEFSNFRRFESQSKIEFVDRDEPVKH